MQFMQDDDMHSTSVYFMFSVSPLFKTKFNHIISHSFKSLTNCVTLFSDLTYGAHGSCVLKRTGITGELLHLNGKSPFVYLATQKMIRRRHRIITITEVTETRNWKKLLVCKAGFMS